MLIDRACLQPASVSSLTPVHVGPSPKRNDTGFIRNPKTSIFRSRGGFDGINLTTMSQPPLRNRPNLRLALTDLTGSPRQSAQSTPPPTSRFITPYPTPGDTPFAKTAYSPYYSAGLKAPTIYETPESFTPRRTSRSCYRNCIGYRSKSLFASKPVWLLLMVVALALWWFNGGSEEMSVVKLGASGLGKEFLHQRKMHDYQFYPASNPKIHVSPH